MADAMKLLPCPFCGEQPIMADNRQTGGACFVQCQTCDAETAGTTTQDEAADLWNRRASPPAREEAPGEGAGKLIADLEALLAAEPVFVVNHPIQRAITALRNRTSEPAREAVAWRRRSQDNHPWTFFDSEEDRKFYTSGDRATRYSVQPLYAHPAPATADKLKVAKEALEEVREGLLRIAHTQDWPDTDTVHDAKEWAHCAAVVALCGPKITQALATLNEEGNA